MQQEQNHLIRTSIDGDYIELDFGGQLSFIKLRSSEARKLADGLIRLAEATEDPIARLARKTKEAIGRQDVSAILRLDEASNQLMISFTDNTASGIGFTFEQGKLFVSAFNDLLEKLRSKVTT